MDFNQVLETYGIPGLAMVAAISVILLAARALFGRSNSETKQDETIRELLVSLNDERRVAQAREVAQQQQNNHLNAELTALKVERGKDEGRLTEFKEAMERERAEWKAERAEWKAERTATDDKLRTLETSILDLQKNQRDNQAKIRELEAEIEILKQKIADKDGEIVSLKATVLKLETEKTQLLDLNTELRRQVDEHSARVENLSQLVKLGNEVEAPPTLPDTSTLVTDNTQAIPDLSVDDTVHPIPLAGEPPQAETPTTDTTKDAA